MTVTLLNAVIHATQETDLRRNLAKSGHHTTTELGRRGAHEMTSVGMGSSGTGIADEAKRRIAGSLSRVLADTFTLYLKTHNFHWNVTGPRFRELHLMFEEQYNELWLATDLVAERIRALGEYAPATYREFTALGSIAEPEGVPSAESMVGELLDGHEAVVRTAREAFALAEPAGDQVTMDLLTQRMQVHEKTAWMLRSLTA